MRPAPEKQNQSNEKERRPYKRPKLDVYGQVKDLTAGGTAIGREMSSQAGWERRD